MSTFWRFFIANFKNILRDRMATFWFLAFPVLFSFLFGLIFGGSGQANFKVGLVTPAGDPLAEGLVSAFESVKSFRISRGSLQKELEALKRGDRSIVIEIPAGAAATASVGAKVEVPVYYNAAEEQTGRLLYSAVNEILNSAERRLSGRPQLLAAEPRSIQAKTLRNIDYLLPGILAMALMQLGLFGALQLVSLREQKILKGLGATPLPRPLILGSEILVRLCLSLVQAALIIGIGTLVFGVHITGSLLSLLGLVLLGAAAFVSLGYLLASFSRTVESGQGIIQLVQFPMMFLSGIFFPLEVMPQFMQPIVKIMPLTYLGDALRQVMVGAPPMYPLLVDAAILGGWLAVSITLSIVFWRWE